LDLDGTGDYVQLPAFAFTNLSQATIEAWMKWRSFTDASRVFDFGERQREMYIGTGVSGGSTLNGAPLKFLIVDAAGNRRRVEVFGGIRLTNGRTWLLSPAREVFAFTLTGCSWPQTSTQAASPR